jgi:hypothetical protein
VSCRRFGREHAHCRARRRIRRRTSRGSCGGAQMSRSLS